MAIAVNPDVRELDFSDNVKVSKFMQDFSDFRMKKWITYRPVNAPSPSAPFTGGPRQFIINMGTGHILDTLYSGLWFTLYFQNSNAVTIWPLQASLPKTSTAWIESVTFQHSNVAAHIDERVCDYDAASAIFTPAKDILSMKQTFFTTEGQTFADNSAFNEYIGDDPYGKLAPVGLLTTGRVNFTTRSFFIPLNRLSTIFNSGKYFFPSLLRGNGEMTLSIRSVSDSLSSVFGVDGSSMAIYCGLGSDDRMWSTARAQNLPLEWEVTMVDMKLVTLNLDNAFLTKEYNAFIASGRKFIRSFKGYNYQLFQVKEGYNRIEIANTHQSISHIILAFQTPYSIRHNGKPVCTMNDIFLSIQQATTLTADDLANMVAGGNVLFGRGGHTDDGSGGTFPRFDVRVPHAYAPPPPPGGGGGGRPGGGAGGRPAGGAGGRPGGEARPGAGGAQVQQEAQQLANMFVPRDNNGVMQNPDGIHNAAGGELAQEEQRPAAQMAGNILVNRVVDASNNASWYSRVYGGARNMMSTTMSMAGKILASGAFDALFRQFISDQIQTHVSPKYVNLVSDSIASSIQAVGQMSQKKPVPKPLEPSDKFIQKHMLKDRTLTKQSDYTVMDFIYDKNRVDIELFLLQCGMIDKEKSEATVEKFSREQIVKLFSLYKHNHDANNEAKLLKKQKFDFLGSVTSLTLPQRMALIEVGNTSTEPDIRNIKTFIDIIKRNSAGTAEVDADLVISILEMEKLSRLSVEDAKKVILANKGKGTPLDTDFELAVGDLSMYNLTRASQGQVRYPTQYRGLIEMAIARAVRENVVFPRDENGDPLPGPAEPPFNETQLATLLQILTDLGEDDRFLRLKNHFHMLPAEPKQLFDLGTNIIEKLQVYRGTGNGETVFSEPVNENMFYHVSREATGDSAENHPYLSYTNYRKDNAFIVISLNTFMRDAHHEHWDGFSTNRVADRLYIEFENTFLSVPQITGVYPWYHELGYLDNNVGLNCKVFTVYDNIYYIDRNNNLNVSDTLLPLQEGRGPISE